MDTTTKETTTKTRRTKTKEDEAAGEEAQSMPADSEAANRRLHDFLSFWRVCELKRCKRGRSCRGEVKACKARHWPLLPEEAKSWLYKAFKLRLEGLSPEDAAAQATKEVNETNELLARLEREHPAARGSAQADDTRAGDDLAETGSRAATDTSRAPRRRGERPVARVRLL